MKRKYEHEIPQNEGKEMEIIKKNQVEILELKSIIPEMKTWGAQNISEQIKVSKNLKIGQLRSFSIRNRGKKKGININKALETCRTPDV